MCLLYYQSWTTASVLLTIATCISYIDLNTSYNYSIPTPFYNKPFEFTVGFRNAYYLYSIAYVFTYISISVGNFNLGIFSLLFLFIIILTYYSKLENKYYIWSFDMLPKEFLIKKIRTGITYSTFSVLPIVLALGIFFTSKLEILLFSLVLGYCYVIAIILAKYSVYPREINIPQVLLLAISVLFPPVLIGVIPYLYYQISSKLKSVLQ